MKSIAAFTLLVKAYEEAIADYTQTLGFTLVEDAKISDTKRRVITAPSPHRLNFFDAAATENRRNLLAIKAGVEPCYV